LKFAATTLLVRQRLAGQARMLLKQVERAMRQAPVPGQG
jgi:hypothetical protein